MQTNAPALDRSVYKGYGTASEDAHWSGPACLSGKLAAGASDIPTGQAKKLVAEAAHFLHTTHLGQHSVRYQVAEALAQTVGRCRDQCDDRSLDFGSRAGAA